MAGYTVEVRRLEPEYGGRPVATLIAYRKGPKLVIDVASKNELFRKHLLQLVDSAYYAIVPGPREGSVYNNHAEFFYPGTVSFFTFLCDRLGWYGYVTPIMNKREVVKTIFGSTDAFDEPSEYYPDVILKAINWGKYTRQNAAGHTILVTVPPGYVAVSTSGKAIGPGKRVGRNGVDLDKPDATWSLVVDQKAEQPDGEQFTEPGEEFRFIPNEEWEKAYAANPKKAKQDAILNLLKGTTDSSIPYHPGMHHQIYDPNSGPYQIKGKHNIEAMKKLFESGVSLQNIMEDVIAGDANLATLGGSEILPDNILLIGIKKNAQPGDIMPVIHASAFPKYANEPDIDWLMFDASEYMNMSFAERQQMREKLLASGTKIHPALLPNVLPDKPQPGQPAGAPKLWGFPLAALKKAVNFDGAIVHNLTDLYKDRIISAFGPKDDEVTAKAEEAKAKEYTAKIIAASEKLLADRLVQIGNRTKGENLEKINEVQKFDREIEEQFFYRDPKDGLLKPKQETKDMYVTSLKHLTDGKGTEDLYFDHIPDTGSPIGLRGYQYSTVLTATNPKRYAAFGGVAESDGLFFNAKMGTGKAIRMDEKILTPKGWVENRDIKVGTQVIGSDGKPTTVIGVFPQGMRQMYRVTFDDGSFVDADGDHQWSVMDAHQRYVRSLRKTMENKRKTERGDDYREGSTSKLLDRWAVDITPKVMTTSEMVKELYVPRGGKTTNYSIPRISAPVEYEVTKALPLDAYTLGALLGDGSFTHASVTFTGNDEEIVNEFSGVEVSKATSESAMKRTVGIWNVKKLVPTLRSLRLMGKKSESKFIPEVYLRASVQDRISLLQGLMDTDGYAVRSAGKTKDGAPRASTGAEFTTVSERLANDVRELVWSLGGKVTINTKVGSYRLLSGERKWCQLVYRLYIQFPEGIGFNPFRLARKANAFGFSKLSHWHRLVKSIEPVGEAEAQCLAVDAPDHLFVVKDFIVTHNTLMVLGSDAVMRNKGLFKGTTLLTVPRAIVGNWRSDLINFRHMKEGKDFFVVEGGVDDRKAIWETIAQQVAAGKPPKFVILGSGKIAFDKKQGGSPDEENTDQKFVQVADEEEDNSPEGKATLAMDLRYVKNLLIDTGNLSCLTVDETGLYVNPDSQRHAAMRALVNLATSDKTAEGKAKNRAVVWTLNGNLMGNSATDTISEVGWVNAFVRGKYYQIRNMFTHKVSPVSERRVFNHSVLPAGAQKAKPKLGLTEFMRSFGHSLNRMNYTKAVGFNGRQVLYETVAVGKEYADVYHKALALVDALSENDVIPVGGDKAKDLGNMRLGLFHMMVGMSYNSAKPVRLVEYGLDAGLMKQIRDVMPKNDWIEFSKQISDFRDKTCDWLQTTSGEDVGWVPKAKSDKEQAADYYTAAQRDKLWEEMISPQYRTLMNRIMTAGRRPVSYKGKITTGWHNPLAETAADKIKKQMAETKLGSRLRMGMQGGSRMAIEAVYNALSGTPGLMRQLLTGDSKRKEIDNMQREHGKTKGEAIMSFITGAGTFGLNFPSEYAMVLDAYNPARVEQGMARYHRDVRKAILVEVMQSSGIGEIVKEIAGLKSAWADAAENVDFSNDDAAIEVMSKVLGHELSKKSFREKLHMHPLLVAEG